jgi:hypothetical protein
MYFYKFTQTGKGIVTSTAPLSQTMETKTIGGIAKLAASMKLQVGDKLPLELTDKPVVNNVTGEVVPNLYWAH